MGTGRDVDQAAPADSVFPAEYGSPTGPLPPPPPPLPPPPAPLSDEDVSREPEHEPERSREPEAETAPVPSAPMAAEPPGARSLAKAKLTPAEARSAVSAVGRRLRRGLPSNGSATEEAAVSPAADGAEAPAEVHDTPAEADGRDGPAPVRAEEPETAADPPASARDGDGHAETGITGDGELAGAGAAGRVGTTTVELPTYTPPAKSSPLGRWRSAPIVEREATASPDDDTVYEALPGEQNRRQRVRVTRGVHSRRLIRRIDVWTVFKVSLVFYTLLLLIVLVAGVAVWNVAQAFGLIHNIEKSIGSLFALKSFHLHPLPVFAYTALGGAVLTVIGTLLNVVMALLYNLISDVVGGAQVVVVTTEPE